MKSHEAPVTESIQQCIDYIKQKAAFGEFGSNAEPHSHSL